MGGYGFSLGRLVPLLVLVGMTAFPFASCGPITFQGHQLLRNALPDVKGTGELGDLAAKARQESPGVPAPDEPGESLFTGEHAWLHWVYVLVFVLGVLALLAPTSSRARLWLGVLGLAGTLLFLLRFDHLMSAEGALGGIDWEIGAYATLLGFGWIAFQGLQTLGPPPRRTAMRRRHAASDDASALDADGEEGAPPGGDAGL
jgi:hypothetical protein